jgi:ribosomal protein S18 acetylase RimI-like enzyme
MRIAAPEDLPEIVRVTNAAYVAEAFCIAGERTDLAEAASLMAAGAFLVLPGPGGLRGSVYLREEGPGRFYLGLLSVDPPCQGQGLARILVEGAEAHARERGAKFLDLTVVSARKELFGFYAKLGFAPCDSLPFRAPEKLRVPAHLVKFTKALVPFTDL